MSFPSSYAHFSPWSSTLSRLALHIFPTNTTTTKNPNFARPLVTIAPALDLGRAWPAIGAQLLCGCILFSESMRRVLGSAALIWLGSVSYTIYLLHGPLCRSLLAYLIFLPSHFLVTHNPAPSSTGNLGPGMVLTATDSTQAAADATSGVVKLSASSTLTILSTTALFLVLFLLIVALWARRVEPLFARATTSVEAWCLPSPSAAAAAAVSPDVGTGVGDGVWTRSRSVSVSSTARGGERGRTGIRGGRVNKLVAMLNFGAGKAGEKRGWAGVIVEEEKDVGLEEEGWRRLD